MHTYTHAYMHTYALFKNIFRKTGVYPHLGWLWVCTWLKFTTRHLTTALFSWNNDGGCSDAGRLNKN